MQVLNAQSSEVKLRLFLGVVNFGFVIGFGGVGFEAGRLLNRLVVGWAMES